MHESTATPQDAPAAEPKDQTVSIRCTSSEKRSVQFLALALDIAESDVLRRYTLDEVLAEAGSRRARLEESAA